MEKRNSNEKKLVVWTEKKKQIKKKTHDVSSKRKLQLFNTREKNKREKIFVSV